MENRNAGVMNFSLVASKHYYMANGDKIRISMKFEALNFFNFQSALTILSNTLTPFAWNAEYTVIFFCLDSTDERSKLRHFSVRVQHELAMCIGLYADELSSEESNKQ